MHINNKEDIQQLQAFYPTLTANPTSVQGKVVQWCCPMTDRHQHSNFATTGMGKGSTAGSRVEFKGNSADFIQLILEPDIVLNYLNYLKVSKTCGNEEAALSVNTNISTVYSATQSSV